MNGIHDLGGMHGFGPIEHVRNEPVFHAAWEARVQGISDAVRSERGYYTIDASRYGIERMAPADYLRASYYERRLATIEYNLTLRGFLTSDEVDQRVAWLRRNPDLDPPPATPIQPSPGPPDVPTSPPVDPARFAVGDLVVTRNIHPLGHKRLPRYARGRQGVIRGVYGPHTFPDANAHGLGPCPQVLYNVSFAGAELWGQSSEPRAPVYLDLWDSYLDPHIA